jgi:hypothetical protein
LVVIPLIQINSRQVIHVEIENQYSHHRIRGEREISRLVEASYGYAPAWHSTDYPDRVTTRDGSRFWSHTPIQPMAAD